MCQIRTANAALIDFDTTLTKSYITTQKAHLSAEVSKPTIIKGITNITMWKERWFLSSNAKDIGTLYLMFALFSGLIGTAFSVLIRLELSGPGVQYIADNQLYNSIITAHAIIMIFFMVKYNAYMFNKSKLSLFSVNTKFDDNADIIIDNNNDNKENTKFKYIKVIVENPYKNRDTILKVTKKQKGVYIWETLDRNMYVGHSINLYNRISYYFMPSILNTKARKVLRHLNKHGFNDIKLTIYIMDIQSSLDEIISLEQHFIDTLKPSLNVDLVASRSGYHGPMTQEMRDRLRKQRGTPVYVYEAEGLTLLHVFDSKQYMYNKISIHHKSLQDCLDTGTLYLDYFFLSLDSVKSENKKLLTLEEIKTSVNIKRKLYKVKHPAAKGILAEFKDDISKNLEFDSLNSLAKHLKGDRKVIREYLKGSKSGYYRGKWKFTYQKKNI
jgi:GIY-YIG catalytic domain/NUMOD1 domain